MALKTHHCLAVVDEKERVCRLVSCDFWGDFEVSRIVTPAIAAFSQKAWSLRNHCKRDGAVGASTVVISAPEDQGRGADGNIAMA